MSDILQVLCAIQTFQTSKCFTDLLPVSNRKTIQNELAPPVFQRGTSFKQVTGLKPPPPFYTLLLFYNSTIPEYAGMGFPPTVTVFWFLKLKKTRWTLYLGNWTSCLNPNQPGGRLGGKYVHRIFKCIFFSRVLLYLFSKIRRLTKLTFRRKISVFLKKNQRNFRGKRKLLVNKYNSCSTSPMLIALRKVS